MTTQPVLFATILVVAGVLALLALKKISPTRLLLCALVGVAGFFSLSMTFIVYLLTEDLWRGVAMPTPPTTQAGASDAITNALTAISAVVAVLTLVLTVGATWFAFMLQRLQGIRAQVESDLKTFAKYREERAAHDYLVLRTRDALVVAKDALACWLVESGGAATSIQEWSLKLEMLSGASRAMRFQAFANLQVLAPKRLGEPVDPILVPVEQYTKLCHQLVRERLLLDPKGLPAESDASDIVEKGLWCLVFDPIERTRFEMEMRR